MKKFYLLWCYSSLVPLIPTWIRGNMNNNNMNNNLYRKQIICRHQTSVVNVALLEGTAWCQQKRPSCLVLRTLRFLVDLVHWQRYLYSMHWLFPAVLHIRIRLLGNAWHSRTCVNSEYFFFHFVRSVRYTIDHRVHLLFALKIRVPPLARVIIGRSEDLKIGGVLCSATRKGGSRGERLGQLWGW